MRHSRSTQSVGIWLEGTPGGTDLAEKVVEFLSDDGRVTRIVQAADGHLTIHTDGLDAGAYSVRITPTGSVETATDR